MNLNDILQSAQGGQVVDNLGSRFGLSPEQVQSALQGLIPAFSKGLQGATQNPGGLGGILSELTNGVHTQSYTDPNATGAAAGAGGNVLGQIFGSSGVTQQIGQHVSQVSGVSPQIIEQMMPVVASILMGGLAHGMNSQGFGGILGQLANAVTGSGTTASAPTVPPTDGSEAGGGGLFGGLVGSVLGGLFGGSSATAASPAAVDSGVGALNGMLDPGVHVPEAHNNALDDIMQGIDRMGRG